MHPWHRQTAQVMDNTVSDIKKSTVLFLSDVFKALMGKTLETVRKEGHTSISPGSSLPGTENHVSFSVTSYEAQDKNTSATIPPLSQQPTT